MRTKIWIGLVAGLTGACLALSLWLLAPRSDAAAVEVWSEGKLLQTLPLNRDAVLEVTGDRGTNVVTVQNGKVAVTEASCPDGYCMARGYCSSGAQIVCLPNRLVIRFVYRQGLDGVAG